VKYQQWVDYHYPTPESAKHQCAEATVLMIKEFPELRRVCGLYTTHPWFTVQHWWCETEYGDVVDPTWRQFKDVASEFWCRYTDKRRYGEINPPPIGKCIYCGEMTFADPNWGDPQFCNSSCSEAFRRSLAGNI
jgi:hypothetical protein